MERFIEIPQKARDVQPSQDCPSNYFGSFSETEFPLWEILESLPNHPSLLGDTYRLALALDNASALPPGWVRTLNCSNRDSRIDCPDRDVLSFDISLRLAGSRSYHGVYAPVARRDPKFTIDS